LTSHPRHLPPLIHSFKRNTRSPWANGAVFDLNDVIAADDPLKRFVTLQSAEAINNGGEIVARGRDSREPRRTTSYLLTPIR
jgi:hypothetical protein